MKNFKNNLITKLKTKNALIGIIGLGYVGVPLMLRYANVGFRVLGFDVNKSTVNTINKGESHIKHLSSSNIAALRKDQKIEATIEMSRIDECDAIIICVPTPLNKYREPDLSFVTATMDSISPFLIKGQALSLESTTYPGTTEELIVRRLEDLNFKVGVDFFIIYSPEREDPGNNNFSTSSIPKICSGYTKDCLRIAIELYRPAINKVIPVSSLKVAEMTKLLENIHRAVNIGLVNEMKIVAHRMGIDIFEVIDAAATKPFGFTPYYPGPGLGGHCIPIDPFYLTWKAREYGINTRFIELSGEINQEMPNYVIERLGDALNNQKKSFKDSKILVLGLAYKKNVDDVRESPSIEIINLLKKRGSKVSYSDPYVLKFPQIRKYNFSMSSINITPKSISKFDAVILATDHDDFDYNLIKDSSKLIIDTRGRFNSSSRNIVRA